jgi:hypothetical protein
MEWLRLQPIDDLLPANQIQNDATRIHFPQTESADFAHFLDSSETVADLDTVSTFSKSYPELGTSINSASVSPELRPKPSPEIAGFFSSWFQSTHPWTPLMNETSNERDIPTFETAERLGSRIPSAPFWDYSFLPDASIYETSIHETTTGPWTLLTNETSNERDIPTFKTAEDFSSRTPSELVRPRNFKCDVVGCRRTAGFVTQNDLSRHKRSIHNLYDNTTLSWRCASVQCRSKEKIWRRLDNFKQHLRRMHPLEDVDHLLQRYVDIIL